MDSVEYKDNNGVIHNGVVTHNGVATADHARVRKPYDYGGNPLARNDTNESSVRLPAFGGDFQPGTYKQDKERKIANPAPLGLCAFALTTFILSLINLNTRSTATPSVIIGVAYAYGGLVQLLAGMWEMAIGNTFGATALSSYGGFWISFAITLTPGGFGVINSYGGETSQFMDVLGFYLLGWFIFTFLMLMCTTRSTVAFFLLFLTLDIAFLMLAIGWLNHGSATGSVNKSFIRAGGAFGLVAAFLAWYNAMAGILEPSNSFVLIPVAHFPWSVKGREMRGKVDNTSDREVAQV